MGGWSKKANIRMHYHHSRFDLSPLYAKQNNVATSYMGAARAVGVQMTPCHSDKYELFYKHISYTLMKLQPFTHTVR